MYTFAARREELPYCKGVGSDAELFLLVTSARSGLALRYRHASRRVSQSSLSCEIVSTPLFVAFRYSEDLYRRELTGRVGWPSEGSSLHRAPVAVSPWRQAGHSYPSWCRVNECVE